MDPVLDNYYRIVAELAQKHEEKRYAWLKQLLLLAAGTLSVLASLRSGTTHTCATHIALSVALSSLGLGILFGAASLYGEVRMAHDALEQTMKELSGRLENPGTPEQAVSFKLPAAYVIAQVLFCTSLVVAVISLVVYAICT